MFSRNNCNFRLDYGLCNFFGTQLYFLLGLAFLCMGAVHSSIRREVLPREQLSLDVLDLDVVKDLNLECGSAFDERKVSTGNKSDQLPAQTRVGLVHIQGGCSPFRRKNASLSEMVMEGVHNDPFRIAYLKSKRVNIVNNSLAASALSVPVTAENGGTPLYIMKVGFGTPQQTFIIVLDTGSDVAWIQCLPCSECYQQADPYFDPSKSSSYEQLACNSQQCAQLQISDCSSSGCLYEVQYGDGSITEGSFSTETITVGGQTFSEFAFGCGQEYAGLLQGVDGLLGLGRGSLSFPSQTTSIFSGSFAYCLPSLQSGGSTGFIEFGQSDISGSQSTPLLHNQEYPSFYYVNVLQISLGGQPLSAETAMTPIVDSGTVITRLPTSIYTSLRDAFRDATSSSLPRPSSMDSFDTCYDLSNLNSVSIPVIAFHLDNGLVYTLPAHNILVLVDNDSTYCLAFLPASNGGLTIIGNYQQQGSSFGFDIQSSTLSIKPSAC
eukprot:c17205_g1_i1 orf=1-1476(-)